MAKALNNGNASFNLDGSWKLPVVQALRQAKTDYTKSQSKLVSLIEDRDAWIKELADMGEEPTTAQLLRSAELVRTEQKIKEIRDRIKMLAGSFCKIITKADEGVFDAESTAKSILRAALEDDEDEDDVQLKLHAPKAGEEVGPDAEWYSQYKMNPAAFGDREWAMVKSHTDKLYAMKFGKMDKVSSPLKLAEYINRQFAFLKQTGDRKGILPKVPDWFMTGVMTLLAEHARGEHGQGEEGRETDSGVLLDHLGDCAQIDVEAWLAICGGKDSPLNVAILKSKVA